MKISVGNLPKWEPLDGLQLSVPRPAGGDSLGLVLFLEGMRVRPSEDGGEQPGGRAAKIRLQVSVEDLVAIIDAAVHGGMRLHLRAETLAGLLPKAPPDEAN